MEYDDSLIEEFEKEINRIKMQTAKAEEGRMRMEQLLKELEANMSQLEAENHSLKEQQKLDHESFDRERAGFETELEMAEERHQLALLDVNKKSEEMVTDLQAELALAKLDASGMMSANESHNEVQGCVLCQEEISTLKAELAKSEKQESSKEIHPYKEKAEALEARHTKLQAELAHRLEELRSVSPSNEVQGKVAELGQGQLDSSQEEIAALKSQVISLEKQKRDGLLLVEESLKEIWNLTSRNEELEAIMIQCESENNAELINERTTTLEKQKNDGLLLVEESLKEIWDKTARNEELEANMVKCQAENSELKAELAHRLEELQGLRVVAALANESSAELEHNNEGLSGQLDINREEIDTLESEVETLAKQKNDGLLLVEESLKEIWDKSARCEELEAENVCLKQELRGRHITSNTSNPSSGSALAFRYPRPDPTTDTCTSVGMEIEREETLKRMEAKQSEMAEELKKMTNEARSYKEKWEETKAALGRDGELEYKNQVMEGVLNAVKADNKTHQDVIAALESNMAKVSEEKLNLELQLAREVQKSTQRRSAAKERRNKLKGKLDGMKETLRDDMVKQLSYPVEKVIEV